MGRHAWKHKGRIPAGYIGCSPDRARACADAGVHMVLDDCRPGDARGKAPVPGEDGVKAYVPAWAARAPEGTSRAMLRAGKRDPVTRAAIEAAGRLAVTTRPGRVFDMNAVTGMVSGIPIGTLTSFNRMAQALAGMNKALHEAARVIAGTCNPAVSPAVTALKAAGEKP